MESEAEGPPIRNCNFSNKYFKMFLVLCFRFVLPWYVGWLDVLASHTGRSVSARPMPWIYHRFRSSTWVLNNFDCNPALYLIGCFVGLLVFLFGLQRHSPSHPPVANFSSQFILLINLAGASLNEPPLRFITHQKAKHFSLLAHGVNVADLRCTLQLHHTTHVWPFCIVLI